MSIPTARTAIMRTTTNSGESHSSTLLSVGAVSELGLNSRDVATFYEREWTGPTALSVPEFYDWQFVQAPANRGRDMNCVAVDVDQEILGVMGLNERPFFLDGRVCAGAELTTWVVSPDARGRGVGASMMSYLQSRYEVLLGMGITQDALPIYLKSGFQYMRAIPRLVRIYDPVAIAAHLQVDKLGRQLIQRFLNQHHAPFASSVVDEAAVERIAIAYFATNNGFVRDWDHLRWRFLQHPYFSYSVVVVSSEDRECIVAYRTDEVDGMRLLHVVDCFGDREAISAAAAFVDDQAARLGLHAADWYVTTPRISSMLRPLGWFSTLDDYFVQFAHLFHPPQLRVPPTTSLVFHARDAMTQIGDVSRLHVTKADLDLDRPTAQFINRA